MLKASFVTTLHTVCILVFNSNRSNDVYLAEYLSLALWSTTSVTEYRLLSRVQYSTYIYILSLFLMPRIAFCIMYYVYSDKRTICYCLVDINCLTRSWFSSVQQNGAHYSWILTVWRVSLLMNNHMCFSSFSFITLSRALIEVKERQFTVWAFRK